MATEEDKTINNKKMLTDTEIDKQRPNIHIEAEIIDTTDRINMGPNIELLIDNTKNMTFTLNGSSYNYETNLLLKLYNNTVLQYFICFNNKKCDLLDIEIYANKYLSILGISTNNKYGEENQKIYSQFIFDEVVMSTILIRKILSSKKFLFIRGINKKNILEIAVMANVQYININNIIEKKEQLLLFVSYDIARNNLTIYRYPYSIKQSIIDHVGDDTSNTDIFIHSLEIPLSIDKAITFHYDYTDKKISIIEIDNCKIIKIIQSVIQKD